MTVNSPTSLPNSRNYPRYGLAVIFLTLFGLAIGIRIYLATHYGPVVASDSRGYLDLAIMMHTHDFTGYNAWRTPGYPWFLNLFNCSPSAVVAAQNTMGLLAVLLVSLLFWKLTKKSTLSALLGFFLAFSLDFLFLDEYILTESLATLLFAIAAAWMIFDSPAYPPRGWSFPLLGGVLVAVLTLTRPCFIVLIPSVVLVLLLTKLLVRPSPPVFLRLAVFLAAALLPILAWMAFNKSQIGRFTLSTTSDYNLIQHTIPFIESASQADPENRYIPILVQAREESAELVRITDGNRSLMSIPGIDVIPPKAYQALSMEAIKQHPGKYLFSVGKSWLRFWRVSLIYDSDYAHSPAIRHLCPLVWPIQKGLWLICDFLFLLSVALVPFTIFLRRKVGWFECLAISILAVSVLQALLTYADNARFVIPMKPLIALMVFYSITVVDPNRFTLASVVRRLHRHTP